MARRLFKYCEDLVSVSIPAYTRRDMPVNLWFVTSVHHTTSGFWPDGQVHFCFELWDIAFIIQTYVSQHNQNLTDLKSRIMFIDDYFVHKNRGILHPSKQSTPLTVSPTCKRVGLMNNFYFLLLVVENIFSHDSQVEVIDG